MSTRATLWLAVVALGFWGCGERGEYRKFNEQDNVTNTAPPAAHEHAEHGPNGGHIVILGDHAYHTEVVFDATTRDVTVYLLDHDMHATPVADAAVSLKLEGAEPIALAAQPLDGEPAGQSSRFKATGDKLPESVKAEEDLHGSIELTAGGQSQSGAISHDHGHEDHADHDHADHK